ncbi:MAG: response regulator [Bacteroidota bacterium]
MSRNKDRFRILVADDDYSNVETILSIIDESVDEVFYAPNGKKAIEIAIEENPDLIVMDWEMPILNGIQAIKELRRNTETQGIPIIVATGVNVEDHNLREALEVGAVDFLKKPFSKIEFDARMRSAIRIQMQHETIQKMLQNEVKQKQRQLASMATLELQKSSLITQLLEQIDRLDRITNYVFATDIKNIQKQLRSHLDLDKSWGYFKLHFEEVHEHFFNKLDKNHKSLSLNERKLCAYIKMGMGNFEISQLTGTADAALRKSINRLKKKLGLSATDEIRKFLFEF